MTTAQSGPGTAEAPILQHIVVDHPLVEAVDVLARRGPFDDRPKMGFDYVSKSQLYLLFSVCGIRYYIQYGENRWEPPNSSLIFGSAFHATSQEFLDAKRQALAADIPFDAAAAIGPAREIGLAYLEREFAIEDDPKSKRLPITMKRRYSNGPPDTRESLKEDLLSAISLAQSEIYPDLVPLAVEQGYVIHWRDKSVLPFLGYVDAVLRMESARRIIDFKSSLQAKDEDDVRLDIGMSGYAFADELASGELTRSIAYGTIVRNKVLKVQMLPVEIGPSDFNRVFNFCKIATLALRAGIYQPNRNGRNCPNCHVAARCDQIMTAVQLPEAA